MIKGTHHSPETRARLSVLHTGKKMSPESRLKMSIARSGKTNSPETRAKLSAINLGKHHTPESKAKMSASHKGKPLPHRGHPITEEHIRKMVAGKRAAGVSAETRQKMSAALKGKTHPGRPLSDEAKRKLSEGRRGPLHPNWQGGISFEPYCPKFNADLKRRIRAFFDHRCIMCGKTTEENGSLLGCHHVEYNKQACCDGEPVHFATLCKRCHNKTNNDRARWESMLHRVIDELYDGRSYFTQYEWKERERKLAHDVWGRDAIV